MAARRSIPAIAIALACWPALSAPTASAFSGGEIVQMLNAQREANGLPGGLVERPEWSAACAKHNSYGAQTGELTHFEDESSPFYTPEGAWAGRNSVLSASQYGWSDGNPWEDAPLHLIQLLGPGLVELGAAENDGHSCVTTWPGYTRPEPSDLTAYSYPGNGAAGVVPTERATESPFVPGDFVGLPQGTATGRHLLSYLSGYPSLGRDEEAKEVGAAATLVGPGGPVEVRVVDSSHPEAGAFMPSPSAFVIPVQPLAPNSGYEASIQWSVSGEQIAAQRFAFTTGTDPVEAGQVAIRRKRATRPCRWYARKARIHRKRAAKLNHRAASLAEKPSSAQNRRQARLLLGRAKTAKRHSLWLERQSKRCRRKAAVGH